MSESREYMNRKEAAKYLGVGVQTLANWLSTGRQKVPHIKFGRTVRYRKSDLDAFAESKLVTGDEAPVDKVVKARRRAKSK